MDLDDRYEEAASQVPERFEEVLSNVRKDLSRQLSSLALIEKILGEHPAVLAAIGSQLAIVGAYNGTSATALEEVVSSVEKVLLWIEEEG